VFSNSFERFQGAEPENGVEQLVVLIFELFISLKPSPSVSVVFW